MKVGDKMDCVLLDPANRETEGRIACEVREIRRDHVSQEPRSVRVKFRLGSGPISFLWVQARYLRPAPAGA